MKAFLRQVLRYYCRYVPLRGRHRLVDKLGRVLAPSSIDSLVVNGVPLPIDHSVPMYRMVYYGMYETSNIAHFKRVLREGDVFIDPGSNIGYIAAVASGLVGRSGWVYALEPSPTCYTLLEKYLHLNTFGNIVLRQAALSDKSGWTKFCDTPRVISTGYAALSDVSVPKDAHMVTVETISVDDLCVEEKIDKVRYLKLDIEGAELLALRGASQMLTEKRIDYVLVESQFDDHNGDKYRDVARLMESRGYKSFRPTTSGKLRPLDTLTLDKGRLDVIWTRF